MSDKRLVETSLTDGRWQDCARWAIQSGRDLSEIAEEEAFRLKEQVLNGVITLSELRGGVAWVNALDREAVELYGVDLSLGEQLAERTARRLMHLAGRAALNELRNKRLRVAAQASISRSIQMCGMGKFETHDMRDRNLVQ